jgi:hypothetical protein
VIPAEPRFRPGFLCLISDVGPSRPAEEARNKMVNVKPLKGDAASAERAHEVDHPSSLVAQFGADKPLHLDCGIDLAPFQIAYPRLPIRLMVSSMPIAPTRS